MDTNITPNSPISARYWSELKGLSNDVKLELITLLSNSMASPTVEKHKSRKGWASRFCGVWKDSRSAEEIMKEIRDSRTPASAAVFVYPESS